MLPLTHLHNTCICTSGADPANFLTRKMVPITGRASSLLEIFCRYDKRFEILKKQNKMEEETEPQT